MAPDISDKTRVPVSWLISGMIGVAGIVLYISDMRTQVAITDESSKALTERVTALENEYKTELKAIRLEIQRLAEAVGERKKG